MQPAPHDGSPGSGEGRRPFLVSGDNRQMLRDIRDSLNHHRLQDDIGGNLRADFSQSTPNLLNEKSNGMSPSPGPRSSLKASRFGYNKKAMAEINQSLAGLENPEKSSSCQALPNGFDAESTEPSEHILKQLVHRGWDEVCTTINI